MVGREAGRWAEDPSGRYGERWWARDGWTQLVRDGVGAELVDEDTSEVEAAQWPPPSGRRWMRVAAVVGGAVVVAASLYLRSRQGSDASAPARPSPRGRTGRGGSKYGRRVRDYTMAGDVTIVDRAGNVVGSRRALTRDEYARAVPDAAHFEPHLEVYRSAMRD